MPTPPTTAPWIDALNALFLPHQVSLEKSVLQEHGGDKWYAHHEPEVVVFAESTEDVSQLMKFAHERGLPVTTRGGGVGYVGGCVPIQGGIVLSLLRMNRLLELSPADGLARVEAGVITQKLQLEAKALNWFYPPDPASLKECTLGGNIATNAGGPRCLKYGVTRHYVMGLTVVLANGDILVCGGRTHKNKTGFDIVGLFCGSEGLLGVITEATLRLIPHPPARKMIAAFFPEFKQAAHAVQAILQAGHLPSALEITDSFTLKAARAYLGQEALPAGNAHLMVEIDGRAAGLEEEIIALQELLQEEGSSYQQVAQTESDCEALWQLRREFSYSLKATNMTKLNEDIVVPRSKLTDLVEFAQQLAQPPEICLACFGHAGDGNIHTNIMVADYSHPTQKAAADAKVKELFSWVLAQGGAITGEHGIGLAKAPWIDQAMSPVLKNVHELLKNALDETHLLNPGKLGLFAQSPPQEDSSLIG